MRRLRRKSTCTTSPVTPKGRATPYGIYDQAVNHAFVMIGISVITAAFAVASIRRWWEQYGSTRYVDSKHLLIECDGGGCNGHRPRLWKYELQKLADDTGLTITVCHYPSGASKWNPIEHRVFSQISRNWAGYPLRSLRRIIGFIRGTTTETGLTVDAEVDPRTYEKGIKINDSQMRSREYHTTPFLLQSELGRDCHAAVRQRFGRESPVLVGCGIRRIRPTRRLSRVLAF